MLPHMVYIIIIILFIYYMLFLQRQGAHSLLQAYGYKLCTETLLQKHWLQHIVAKTLLQLQNIDITLHKRATHPTTQPIKDWGTQITTDKIKQLVGKTEKVSFSSGSESRDTIRRADLLRKRVPSRRGRVCLLHVTSNESRWEPLNI